MAKQAQGSGTVTGERIARVRTLMREAGIDALLVRGTDRYLNEYVPAAESLRIWLSGFTGSVGDVVVAAERAWVFVDGRYYLQADQEVDPAHVEVFKVPFGQGIDEAVRGHLAELARKHGPGLVVGYEPEKTSVELVEKLAEAVGREGARCVAARENLVAKARGAAPATPVAPAEAIPVAQTGESTADKAARLRRELERAGAGATLLTRLDEIAWMTNLRAYEIDMASTFRGLAWVDGEGAVLFTDPSRLGDSVRKALGTTWTVEPEAGWEHALARRLAGRPRLRVLLDPAGVTEAVRASVAGALGASGEIALAASPVAEMKARKNPRELATLADSYRRADAVVAAAVQWLNGRVAKGKGPTEAELAEKVEALFREAGARSLSFRVISAFGANGAVIHYSHPDASRRVKKGELVLLDTGAYFEAGYATDLTRTFLAGGNTARPTAKQKTIFTLVLKSSIRGMSARFPRGTTGVQLDAICRAPIWEAGYDYLHGTGHGVGVLVHEAPPRVATRSSMPLEPGMVFSIEPGIYLAGWGGVRIENLVTVVEDPKAEGFYRVKPLTFAPIDRKLVDPRLLSVDEKQWLRRWLRKAV